MADVARAPGAAGATPASIGRMLSENIMGLAVVTVVMFVVIPMPTPLLDAMMALNLSFALLVLLTVLYSRKPTEFSLFPTVLLVATVFGLAINISSARLILVHGINFDGRMIGAFSTFVVGTGGNEAIVIGIIILVIFIIVQLVVITKGATRISEVAARFALDGMPVKMMAIDTEFGSGSISEEEAQRRKAQVQKDSHFYSAMDGASKFISGNVKVGIAIIALEMIGGLIIGVTMRNEPLASAVGIYITLAIGDGLVTQLPAFLIATAMGIVVTRSAEPGYLTEQVAQQFTITSRSYWIGAVVLGFLALLPGFPRLILIALAGVLALAGYQVGKKRKAEESF
ncbi:MAG: flagellar biosynthesis protein FlhA, partial [Treponema sp.]|nr:flagellar biosynthesis protein FlhA [Treponema sp.]